MLALLLQAAVLVWVPVCAFKQDSVVAQQSWPETSSALDLLNARATQCMPS